MNEEKTTSEQTPDTTAAPAAEESAAKVAADQALAAKLAEAEQQANTYRDQFLRLRAEMDNLRRRTERELEAAHKFALERFAGELLPVRDSLEMGLAAAAVPGVDIDKVKEGIDLTAKMLAATLEKFGIKEVNPLNQKFNPEQHQAMSMREQAGVEPNTVVAVYQKGYLLNDRLLRPAMVVVAKAVSGEGGTEVGSRIDQSA